MDWKEIAAKIVEYAPTLGGALGGPPGAAAGLAMKALAGIFGLGAESTPEEIKSAIDGDPDRALKLRLAEMSFTLEWMRLENADRDSARDREVETTKSTGTRDTNLYVLAWVIMGGFIGLIASIIILEAAFRVTLSANPLLSLLVGSLATDAGMVVGYFFGSSKGSNEKNRLLAGGGK